jgi:hypothetical protein
MTLRQIRTICVVIVCVTALALAGCTRTQKGAAIGGASGAAVGGAATGSWGGAAVGGAVGAAAGGLIGHETEDDD